jgi:PAS domain S-box-containing protein
MARRILALRASFGQGLKRDLIQQTAYFVFVFRILEGLAAWLLFNTVFLAATSHWWALVILFLAYFLVDAFFYLQYRAGRISNAIVLADIAANIGTMLVVARWTGGVVSPVILIVLFKIAAYAFIFSVHAGIVASALTLAGIGALGVAEGLDWYQVTVTIDPSLESQIQLVFRIVVLVMILVSATWLFNQLAAKERQVRAEAERAKKAAERERAGAAVMGALLAVSEAISRLTRLEDILDKVVDLSPRVLAVDYCGILLWNDETATYRGATVSGVEPALAYQFTTLRLAPDQVPDLEWVRRVGHCALIPAHSGAPFGEGSGPMLLTAPLLSGGRFYGVVQFARREGSSFTQRDFTIADGVAGQTAVALERARLIEESGRLVRALESTGEAVLITDRHRRIVFVNQAFSDIFGYAREEILGRDSLAIGNEMSEQWIRDVQDILQEQNWRGEATARRKDGTAFPVALHVSLIRTADNRLQGSVAILEDISAQRHLQEQLHRADRLAAAGELAAGVAHEVNNALAGILGQTELAHEAQDMQTLRTAMAFVEAQGHRIADIVQGLLGFARPQPPQRGLVDLRQLVRDTLTLMAHELGRSRVRSETHLARDVSPILADAKQIQQVLVNLFTNAMQAMEPRGGGAMVVTVQSTPGIVCLEVQDRGMGIDAEALPRVFDPFFSTKPKGSGLGLSVSYAIVQAHGGDMTVRSELNEGTTFTVKMPAVATAHTSAPRTALLIDDDPAVAETLTDMLEREGLTVRRAATGGEGLAILASEIFDAIFLDVRLPDISGPDVYARLAAEHPDQARRVVFVTGGLWRMGTRGLREQLPAQPTLSKPCTSAQIREVLRLLRDQRAAA